MNKNWEEDIIKKYESLSIKTHMNCINNEIETLMLIEIY